MSVVEQVPTLLKFVKGSKEIKRVIPAAIIGGIGNNVTRDLPDGGIHAGAILGGILGHEYRCKK